ncbi:hypothetical protein ACG2K1_12395 [Neisseria sp. 23W00296]|uniref:hypothetical protein n=1 Tax=unclassified Neisseria TaxID=2623750 RepID=UPI0002A427C8|nr:hypothetical protein [Neisseria sp. KEM232]EKY09708.1 hypothetical protein HMPREF9120_00333 [Neisseria sp. oral taxon 020 str. F0370]
MQNQTMPQAGTQLAWYPIPMHSASVVFNGCYGIEKQIHYGKTDGLYAVAPLGKAESFRDRPLHIVGMCGGCFLSRQSVPRPVCGSGKRPSETAFRVFRRPFADPSGRSCLRQA